MKRNLPYIIGIFIMFYIVPEFIKDTGTAMFILLFLFPILCFIMAFANGMSKGTNWIYIILVPLLFAPTIFIYYKGALETMIYGAAYFITSIIGNLLGDYVRRDKVSEN